VGLRPHLAAELKRAGASVLSFVRGLTPIVQGAVLQLDPPQKLTEEGLDAEHMEDAHQPYGRPEQTECESTEHSTPTEPDDPPCRCRQVLFEGIGRQRSENIGVEPVHERGSGPLASGVRE